MQCSAVTILRDGEDNRCSHDAIYEYDREMPLCPYHTKMFAGLLEPTEVTDYSRNVAVVVSLTNNVIIFESPRGVAPQAAVA